jgi:hypothetical protein
VFFFNVKLFLFLGTLSDPEMPDTDKGVSVSSMLSENEFERFLERCCPKLVGKHWAFKYADKHGVLVESKTKARTPATLQKESYRTRRNIYLVPTEKIIAVSNCHECV